MKVSVVIPAYNEEEFIGECLKALQNQTESADEIIVVDNNSSDKTAEIATSLGARVISEKEQGMIPARNTGFNAARYEIIARCDADSRPHADWIANIKKGFKDKTVVGVTGTNEFYDAPDTLKPVFEKIFTIAYFQGTKQMIGHQTFYGSNMALRKSAWEQIKDEVCLDDKMVHEDIDLSIHIAPHGRIVYDPMLMVNNSFRAARANLPVFMERMAKWPRSKFVHTPLKRFIKNGKNYPAKKPSKKHIS